MKMTASREKKTKKKKLVRRILPLLKSWEDRLLSNCKLKLTKKKKI